MITTVCLNPAVDQSAVVEQLKIGQVNRLGSMRSGIGGKGITVAIVLAKLRVEAGCVSFVGEEDMQLFVRGMEADGAPLYAIPVPGNVRRNLKIIDTVDGLVTEFNEQGAAVSAAEIARLTGMLKDQAGNSQTIALCGSLPLGCAPDTYRVLMQAMPDKRWVVDTSGEALRQAVLGKPYLIKPNLSELEELTGEKLTSETEILNAAAKLCQAGVTYVVVSQGEKGALLTDGSKSVFAPAIPVSAASTVGAGDSMLAGLLYGISRGESPFDSLKYGIAAGAACVNAGSAHAFIRQTFEKLLPKAEIREL